VTRPDGGYFLWLQLAEGVDSIELHRRALARGVSIAPGPIFSARRAFRNCVRLNYGYADAAAIDAGVRVIADVLRSML
jgi:DNA-binding transcriptional MocR family regulator